MTKKSQHADVPSVNADAAILRAAEDNRLELEIAAHGVLARLRCLRAALVANAADTYGAQILVEDAIGALDRALG